jgi:uncharacterized Zn-binding protein involved in type VI secretion
MPAVHRLFDKNAAKAEIVKVFQSSVFANNLPVSIDGSKVAPHLLHRNPFTANGSKDVFIENKSVNRQNDKDTCGHPRVIGSPDVFVNG